MPETGAGPQDPDEGAARRRARRQAARSARIALAALAAVIAFAGLALGWATGSGGTTLGGGQDDLLEIRAPDDWDQVEQAPPLPGLALRSSLPAAPGGDPERGVLLAGLSDAQGPALMPPGLAGSPRPVMTGELEALHHRDLAGREAQALAIPTVEGVVTLLCLPGPDSAPGFGERCLQTASTVELHGPRALPVGPDPAYARGVSHVVESLNDRLRRRQRRLRAGETREQLQAAADEVASAWNAAAGAIRRVSPGPANRPVHVRLARALDAAGQASAARTRAIRDGEPERAAAAGAALRRAAGRAQQTLAALPALGYEVG